MKSGFYDLFDNGGITTPPLQQEAAPTTVFDKKVAKYAPLAEAGNAEASYRLGILYCLGDEEGENINKTMGRSWLSNAAHGGHVTAQMSLGMDYAQNVVVHGMSDNIEEEVKEAVKYLTMALDNPDQNERVKFSVPFWLGRCYSQVESSIKDISKASEYFATSADRGHPRAQYELALIILSGQDGMEPDKELAQIWLEEAAKQNLQVAKDLLASETFKKPSLVFKVPLTPQIKNLLKTGSKREREEETDTKQRHLSFVEQSLHEKCSRPEERSASK